MKRIILFFKVTIFVITVFKSLILLGYVFSDYNHNQMRIESFYKKRNNTFDGIFMGSSHALSFSPQIIEEVSGLRSYIYANDGRNFDAIYYDLHVILKNQKPKYVFIECFTIWNSIAKKSPGISRNFNMQPISFQKYINLKKVAIFQDNPEKHVLENIFPILENHNNRKSSEYISSGIKRIFDKNKRNEIKNYTGYGGLRPSSQMVQSSRDRITNYVGSNSYYNYENLWDNHHIEDFEEKLSVLEKINDLKEKYGFKLIYVYAPMFYEIENPNYDKKHQFFKEIFMKTGDDFIDLNLMNDVLKLSNESYMNEPSATLNNNINVHLSNKGSIPASIFIGEWLAKKEKTELKTPEIIEYEEIHYIHLLRYSKNLNEYMENFRELRNCIAIVSIRDEGSTLWEKYKDIFQHIGFSEDLEGKYRNSYIGIVESNGKKHFEKVSSERINHKLYFGDNNIFEITSAGWLDGNVSSIKYNGEEQSKNRIGLNIVIYDKEKREIVDSVNVDTFKDSELKINR